MRAYVGQKQLPAFFKFQGVGQRKNMNPALALQPNVGGKCRKTDTTKRNSQTRLNKLYEELIILNFEILKT